MLSPQHSVVPLCNGVMFQLPAPYSSHHRGKYTMPARRRLASPRTICKLFVSDINLYNCNSNTGQASRTGTGLSRMQRAMEPQCPVMVVMVSFLPGPPNRATEEPSNQAIPYPIPCHPSCCGVQSSAAFHVYVGHKGSKQSETKPPQNSRWFNIENGISSRHTT